MSVTTAQALTDAALADVVTAGDTLRRDQGDLDPLRLAQLFASGAGQARAAIGRLIGRLDPATTESDRQGHAARIVAAALASGVRVSGAEAAAVLLAAAGVEQVFAYGGTSELPMCDAVQRLPGISLINGRGDKESAFMAAGASLLRPNLGAAILHGARGLTNAGGALADARRNEAGTVFVVGMASTSSSRFLPPHGEDGLIEAMGHFARWHWETPALPRSEADQYAAAVTYVRKLHEAIAVAGRQPWGPVLFGLPQDLAESAWVPLTALAEESAPPTPSEIDVEAALDQIRVAQRPVVLVDDYALRSPGIREALNRFASASGAVTVQLRYRRGLMLFERLHAEEVPSFAGWLNPFSPAHRQMLANCDLLITVEDRNIYRRVVGDLPPCRKIAINTDPAKVMKNEYLTDDDVLVEGDGAVVLDELARGLGRTVETAWPVEALRQEGRTNPEPPSAEVDEGRRLVAGAVADLLRGWTRPVVIDDSSMFGGLLAEYYDDLPAGLRVFGGHAGFVGAGLPYAIGLAVAEPASQVLCVLGDQAFTNSHQALVAAFQQRANLVILVCNNGESVSLKKQGRASYGDIPRGYLDNTTGLDYCRIAEAYGVHAERAVVPVGQSLNEVTPAAAGFGAALAGAAAADGPALVELVLPSDPEAWRGIWVVQGFEQAAAVPS